MPRIFDDALDNLRHVFSFLRNATLKLSPNKCELFQKQVFYLGHMVSANGIAADPRKVNSIASWPGPRDKKELRSFLGLCSYYRKFICSFADIARPLHKLTEKDIVFAWSEECDEAFRGLQSLLTSS